MEDGGGVIIGQLVKSLVLMVEKLRSVITNILTGAEELSSQAEQLKETVACFTIDRKDLLNYKRKHKKIMTVKTLVNNKERAKMRPEIDLKMTDLSSGHKGMDEDDFEEL